MTNDELRALIQRFLDLVHNGVGSVEENERTLVELLDRLALAVHEVPEGAVTSELEAPDRNYQGVRAVVEARFPNFGLYGAGQLLLSDGDPDPIIGDAIDDITDIALELQETAWTWDHIGVQDALWTFHFGFTSHWGLHLRQLQAYLHEQLGGVPFDEA